VATGDGLCLFNPKGEPTAQPTSGKPMFAVFRTGDNQRANYVTRLFQDHTGTVWCGTHRGLFRVDRTSNQVWQVRQVRLTPIDVGLRLDLLDGGWIYAFAEDGFGKLWIGAATGLFMRWPDGRAAHYAQREGLPEVICRTPLVDRAGNLWVGMTEVGLF